MRIKRFDQIDENIQRGKLKLFSDAQISALEDMLSDAKSALTGEHLPSAEEQGIYREIGDVLVRHGVR